MIEFTLEEITPEDARRILAEHDEAVANGEINNRGRKTAAIRRYAADQASGQWYAETGETLKFRTHDRVLRGKNLLDGQNRLAACVQSGVPLRAYVARGVEREAFSYIDGGEKRTLRDVLLISREPEAADLSRTLNWLCQWDSEAGKLMNSAVTNQRARKLLESDRIIKLFENRQYYSDDEFKNAVADLVRLAYSEGWENGLLSAKATFEKMISNYNIWPKA